ANFRWTRCGWPAPGSQSPATAKDMPPALPWPPFSFAIETEPADMTTSKPSIRQGAGQEQLLTILSREGALARFEAVLFPRPVQTEERALAETLGLALAEDVVAPIDVPPFDRSNVDGFAVRAVDLAAASEARAVLVAPHPDTAARVMVL